MHYFYDHQTDELSILLGDFDRYATSEPLGPGVIVHMASDRRPLAMEIAQARDIVNVTGLSSFEQKDIAQSELESRMNATDRGRRAWRALAEENVPALHLVGAS